MRLVMHVVASHLPLMPKCAAWHASSCLERGGQPSALHHRTLLCGLQDASREFVEFMAGNKPAGRKRRLWRQFNSDQLAKVRMGLRFIALQGNVHDHVKTTLKQGCCHEKCCRQFASLCVWLMGVPPCTPLVQYSITAMQETWLMQSGNG